LLINFLKPRAKIDRIKQIEKEKANRTQIAIRNSTEKAIDRKTIARKIG